MAHGKNRTVTVYKHPAVGVTPATILLAQRHLEKESPKPMLEDKVTSTYIVPVDLLDLAVPGISHTDVRTIQLVYTKRGT